MIPILYDALEKDFTTNGIGFLTDAVSCIVTEERNGIYELALTYPTKGHLAKYLENDAIIKAKANDEDNPQLFRIYNHTKAVGENTTWYGEHISYELNGNPVDCFTVSEVNGERALHELLDAAILPHEFTCASDITTTNSTSIDGAVSVRNAMGGTEGSLLDVWGGEYHYDNYRVELLKARGVDNGVTIEYGKNLIDAKQEKNIADVVTVIFPYAKYTAEGAEQKTYITLPEKVLQHENANKYATLRCEIVDFSGEWESGTIITTDMLRAKAKEYLGKLSIEPKVNITVSFASLKKTKDYKNIKAFESVKLCDIVTVKILPLDINVKAKITKVKYDSIKERYESLEIGAARTNLTKTILKINSDSITQEVKRAKGIEDELRASIKVNAENITSCVTKGNVGSYITQYYNNVIVAFNNSSKYVQINAGEIAIYDYGVSASKKRAVFDEQGNHFYRDNYYVGKIGTNQWVDNNAHKGLVFDLETQGKYMAWAQKPTEGASSYTTILCYSRADSIFTQVGLHLGCNMYGHGWILDNVDLRNCSANGYTTFTGTLPVVLEIHKTDNNGGIGWTYGNVYIKNGLITSIPQ